MNTVVPTLVGSDPAVLADATRGLAPITFLLEDEAIGYLPDDAAVEVVPRDLGGTAVRLSRTAFDDLVSQVRTVMGLMIAGELTVERGSFEKLADWDPVLKYLHAGIPPYDPDRIDLGGRDPLASFTLDDDDDELRAQLNAMGYLHVRSVFSAEEMAAANREVDRLAAAAAPGDDQSWWVTGESGDSALCRLVYASLRSTVLAELERDARIRRLGTLLNPALRAAPDRMEGAAVLLKVPGKTSGLSNIPWHQDCGLGGHSILCPAVGIGIQLTGSSAATGNLQVIPGSHGQAVHYRWMQRSDDIAYVSIDTEPGDVTVHVQDVMHASPPPTGTGGRRTMYVTYYPPALWDHIGPGEAYNDLVRNRTDEVARLQ
ncbi:phytanoyl-CoA dioxygenase family protein [Mycobacterium sp. M26]|uniref:phytanoyl-CoA dioxygenase family protein n=1 Tax=Mycobacterium sp. M26 TaxID=1762962 RepID=UPI00073E4131|nr:phytanoyl-CoA dioxygenase family protein [Mycobacterium sp. M26]